MPDLPRFYSTKQLPGVSSLVPISPSMAGIEAEAVGAAGDRLTELGRTGWELSQKINEAAEAEKILNNHYKLKDDFRVATEKFRERRDYDKFDEDYNTEMEAIRKAYEGGLTSNSMRRAFDHSFLGMSSGMKDALAHKKAQIITENALGAFSRTYDEATNDYISTSSEYEKSAIKGNLELEAEILVSRNIMEPVDRDKLLSTFDSQAEEVQIRNIGLIDPLKAYGILMDKTALTNIDPLRRVRLTEHMEVRARLEEGRQEKLVTAIQRENQANALDNFAYGKLDFDRLMMYRARDPETGMPGLSDAFFTSMLEKLKLGKDIVSDPKVFEDLYLDENLTRAKVDAKSSSLSVHDQRTLLGRILQERREDERDSKSLRKEAEAEERRVVTEERRVAREQETRDKERRNHYTSDARSYMKKAFGELSIEAEEGGKMLRTFQGYVDDPKIPPEELVEYAQKVIETRKGGLARQFWNWMFPDKAKPELIPPTPVTPAPVGKPGYGLRVDKTAKGPGFLGELKRPDGRVSTELSIGVTFDGKERLIPTMVPTLSKDEIDYLLKSPTNPETMKTPIGKIIMQKAVEHARKRIAEGKSPFKGWEEEPGVRGTRKPLDEIFGGKKVEPRFAPSH